MYGIFSLIAGFIFGIGLTVSQMINPTKIQNFLDITGNWDPSLLFVMLGAVSVTFVGYQRLFKSTSCPRLQKQFDLPQQQVVDTKLICGAIIFGIGWGITGYCPGPVITAVGLGIMDPVYCLTGIAIGMICYKLMKRK